MISKFTRYGFFLLIATSWIGCSDQPAEKNRPANQTTSQAKSKPVATIQDTMTIRVRAAVFYEPDDLQLEKIKAVTEPNVFEATFHEYHSQVNNAKSFLQQHWPDVKIINAKNVRYLRFEKLNHSIEMIDLDSKNDAIGLFLFDPVKSPSSVDMMSIDDVVPRYFANH